MIVLLRFQTFQQDKEETELDEEHRVIVLGRKFGENFLRIAVHQSISDSDVDLIIRKLRFVVQDVRLRRASKSKL